LLRQWASFLSKRTIESMDSLAVIHGQKSVERTVRFKKKLTIESMGRLALMHGQNLVKERLDFQ